MNKKKVVRSGVKSVGKKCSLYQKLPNGAVRYKCVLDIGPPNDPNPHNTDPRASIGLCGIRHNWKGDLYLFDFGKPGSVCVDPIEKTPLYHFFPGENIYTIGTIGCNFRCSYCQNWTISQAPKIAVKRRNDGYLKDIEDAMKPYYDLSPEKAVKQAISRNCKLIEFNYNEPTIWIDTYVLETAKLSKKNGLFTTLCSNGYQSIETINLIAPYIDAVNIDLKGFSNKFYSDLCGGRLKVVMRNIELFVKIGIWVEVTTLLIPNHNDSEDELIKLAKFLHSISPDIVWHVSRYHKDYLFRGDDSKASQTPIKTLLKAYEIGKKVGLRYVYVGNYTSQIHHATFCYNCKTELVDRGGWGHNGKVSNNMDSSFKCKKCKTQIAGFWNEKVKNGYSGINVKLKKLLKVPTVYSDIKYADEMYDDGDKVIKILFASQTGVTETFAMEVYEEAMKNIKKKGNKLFLVDLMNYNEKKLVEEQATLIIMTSTHFFGRIPRNGERFFNHLHKLNQKDLLNKLNYCIIGFGSTGIKRCHKDTYQKVAIKIEEKMKFLGAKKLISSIHLNKKDNYRNSLKKAKKITLMLIQKIFSK